MTIIGVFKLFILIGYVIVAAKKGISFFTTCFFFTTLSRVLRTKTFHH